ncbi:MAG TPA: hypothetical protein VMT52_06160 [Planctomycetota bacterium]|nr:hypothetical protein [Planctomycetota bacterium]
MSEVSKTGAEGARFVQGYRAGAESPDALSAAVDAALDYRGDVTLLLEGGVEVTGYLSNREAGGPEPYVEVLTPTSARPERLLYRHIHGVSFTGKDPASGKSWETWVKKHKAKKEAEARGEKVEPMGLFPDPL